MTFSYEPLWNTLEKKNIKNKTELKKIAQITSSTLSKLSKNEHVSLAVLDRICEGLSCDIEETIEHVGQVNKRIKKNSNLPLIKVVSLFSGIGGFEVGLENSELNAEVVFSSEIDRFAKNSYAANFPSNNLHSDITKIAAEDVPNHDLLIGGFPCQAFSIAGSRNGFEDTRGTLFFDVLRILKAKKPKYILLENVKNLVSHDDSKTIRVILSSLNALDYTIDFTIINSQEAGLPQSRERTYIVGILGHANENYKNDTRSKKIDVMKKELNKTDFKSFNFFSDLKFNNKSLRIKDILEKEVPDKYFFNSDKVLKFLAKFNVEAKETDLKDSSRIKKIFDVPREVINDNERQRRVYDINGLSPTILARSDSTKILIEQKNKKAIRKFTPIENLKVQGFPREHINKIKKTNVSDTQLYKQSGNAVSPPVTEGIFNLLSKYITRGSEEF